MGLAAAQRENTRCMAKQGRVAVFRPTLPTLPPHTTQVYPLIASVTLGCAFAVYSMTLNLTTNPDVKVARGRRSTDAACEAPNMPQEGKAYVNNVYRAMGKMGST